ncbi:MAG TPA: hypothetical protein DCQ31_05085 [Bacteroidales bacterium]|nr:hypothetical protein [Bacteroidales bacterium]
MNFKFLFSLWLLFLCIEKSEAQHVKVGLFHGLNLNMLFIEADNGKFKLIADGKEIYEVKKQRTLTVEVKNGKLLVERPDKSLGSFSTLKIEAKNEAHSLIMKPLNPKLPERSYNGPFEISVAGNVLKIISNAAFDPYLAGVIETETGSKNTLELYKTQAIICRTYAVGHLNRHAAEGFHLCDGVHCQAYKGRSRYNDDILKAVKTTNDWIITYKDSTLTETVFSANCGGQTANSEEIWAKKVPYLRSVRDTFCTTERGATWNKTVTAAEWNAFLRKQAAANISKIDTVNTKLVQQNREKYFNISIQIPVTAVRDAFGTRSSFFSIEPKGENIEIQGRGYGHGVGMCQEGAIKMARLGYKYDQIIKFYYTDVLILPGKKLGFWVPK